MEIIVLIILVVCGYKILAWLLKNLVVFAGLFCLFCGAIGAIDSLNLDPYLGLGIMIIVLFAAVSSLFDKSRIKKNDKCSANEEKKRKKRKMMIEWENRRAEEQRRRYLEEAFLYEQNRKRNNN